MTRTVQTDLLDEMEREVAGVEAEARVLYEVFEPGLRLDIASRAQSEMKVARHIHQMCLLHVDNFRRANFVKLAYIGRFYLTEVASTNPIGTTAAARALLELHAFLRRIQSELTSVRHTHPDWKQRGEAFFDTVIRARYGTSSPRVDAALAKAGVPQNLRRPYRIGECVAAVAKGSPEHFGWITEHYSFLCDWVHANQSSQTASTAGGRIASEITSSGGGAMLVRRPATVNQHQYGARPAFELVLEATLRRARASFVDANAAINETPETPLTPDELLELTGSATGTQGIPTSRESRH